VAFRVAQKRHAQTSAPVGGCRPAPQQDIRKQDRYKQERAHKQAQGYKQAQAYKQALQGNARRAEGYDQPGKPVPERGEQDGDSHDRLACPNPGLTPDRLKAPKRP